MKNNFCEDHNKICYSYDEAGNRINYLWKNKAIQCTYYKCKKCNKFHLSSDGFEYMIAALTNNYKKLEKKKNKEIIHYKKLLDSTNKKLNDKIDWFMKNNKLLREERKYLLDRIRNIKSIDIEEVYKHLQKIQGGKNEA